MMTTTEMVKTIESYNEWKNLMEEAKKEVEAIEKVLKDELIERETEELEADQYIVRLTNVLSNRFDTTSFKKAYEELYKSFTKQVASKRFSISA